MSRTTKAPVPEECKNCPDRHNCEELTEKLRSAMAKYEAREEKLGAETALDFEIMKMDRRRLN